MNPWYGRFDLAIKYIQRYFPAGIRVADVGSGYHYELTKLLRGLEFDAHAFDPCMDGEEDYLHPREFTEDDAADFDLLVGIYSCGAEPMLAQAANKHKKPLVLIFCGCSKPNYKNFGHKYNAVLNKLREFRFSDERDDYGFPAVVVALMYTKTRKGEVQK